MKNIPILFWSIMVVLLAACSTEELISTQTLPTQMTKENSFANMLVKSLREQPDVWKQTQLQFAGNNILFDYSTFAISNDFGQHYSVPYSDASGMVKGCLIFRVNAEEPATGQFTLEGKLSECINLDLEALSNIPQDRRYLYSIEFKRWKESGLKIADGLTDFADFIDEEEIQKEQETNTRSQSEPEMDFTRTIGDAITVFIDFKIIPRVSSKIEDIEVTALSKETMCRIAQNICNLYFENILREAYTVDFLAQRMTIQIIRAGYIFNAKFLLDEVTRGMAFKYKQENITDFIYQYMYYGNFVFMPYPEKYIAIDSDGNTIGGYGGGSSTGGSSSNNGGSIHTEDSDSDPTKHIPCRNDEEGKANPLQIMYLMPPSTRNLKGATFGITRTDKFGLPKQHSGIDLMAMPGTPVFALFDGVITYPYETNQPDRENGKYPAGYKGDLNEAGNRIYIESIVNGKKIRTAFFHLQAGNAAAERNGKILAPGDTVKAGEIVGYTGVTGNANHKRPHLHLGIKNENGQWINPTSYLNATVVTTSFVIKTPCDE